MLTLEQVRAVNDGFSCGDFKAALQPLEEQIDLRYSELPRLEKSSIAALRTALHKPEVAQLWAAAVFAPNISVRRFVRKTLLGLKHDAASVAEPLQAQMEAFWANEARLPWGSNARETAAHNEQDEKLQSAAEILLRADVDRSIVFWEQLFERGKPLRAQQEAVSLQWQERQNAYSKASAAATDEIIRSEFGEEFLDKHRYYQLPSRVWIEIRDRVENLPEVQKALAEVGEHPWGALEAQWQPESYLAGALYPYMSANATGPQREVAEKVRVYLWNWLETALNPDVTPQEREQALELLGNLVPSYQIAEWLEAEKHLVRLFELLETSRRVWAADIERELQAEPQYRRVVNSVEGLWLSLAQTVTGLFSVHSQSKKMWLELDSITPERVRALKVESEHEEHELAEQLETVAKTLEALSHETLAIDGEPAGVDAPDSMGSYVIGRGLTGWHGTLLMDFSEPEETDGFSLGHSPNEWKLVVAAAEKTGEAENVIIARWRHELLKEIKAITTPEKRAEKLIEPPLYLDAPLQRLPLWQVWCRQDGEESLKVQLWPRVESKAWALYEERLEAYRRVETDEIAPQLSEKLSEKELKEWKSTQRALKRDEIQQQIEDIAVLLRAVEGLDADVKMLRLLKRPGVRDLLREEQTYLLRQAGDFYEFNPVYFYGNIADAMSETLFLNEKWGPLLAELETELLGAKKLQEWEKTNYERQFAIASYRLNTPAGRVRFLELAPRIGNLAFRLAGMVTMQNDIESWLLLLSTLEWPEPQMRTLWTQTRQNSVAEKGALERQVLEMLSTTTREKAAKYQIELVKELTPAELAPHIALIASALESPLLPVKRWALATLPTLNAPYDYEQAAQIVGEMLWSENGAVVKEAAKYLGAQSGDAAPIAFEALQDALSLENQPILEVVLRALSTLNAKHPELELSETSQERLTHIVELAPHRFNKFAKKLGLSLAKVA